ncbi:MAG: hypothetical protein LUD12_00790, partial [Lachnospiraceae bacterium]|nr:hypothetical protein [Lachnospiraceae bacterium]
WRAKIKPPVELVVAELVTNFYTQTGQEDSRPLPTLPASYSDYIIFPLSTGNHSRSKIGHS